MDPMMWKLYYRMPQYVGAALRGRIGPIIREWRETLALRRRYTEELRRARPGFGVVFEDIVNRSHGGEQYISGELAQFSYAWRAIGGLAPTEVHDVGSHRIWLIGLAAQYRVHTLDVRKPALMFANEVFHQGQAEHLPWETGTVECLTSLCSIEHFGLGCYGDPWDPSADLTAIAELKRVLKPGGHLVLSTLCTGLPRSFTVINTRRIYAVDELRRMFAGLTQTDETFFSMRTHAFTNAAGLQTQQSPGGWDIYLGTWRKPD